MEAGFIAASQGWTEQASEIFSAVAVLSPDANTHVLGQCLTYMSSRKFDEARHLLEDRLKSHGADDDIQAFLGLVLQVSGKEEESRKALEGLLNKSGPQGELARDLMEK